LPADPSTQPGSYQPPQISSLIPFDGVWRFDYSMFGPPAFNWKDLDFDEDAAFWPGPNQAIFANLADTPDPFNTSLSLGSTAYYFRHRFNYTNTVRGACLRLLPLIDDGAVFYLNGREILRLGMPPGGVDENTLAARNVGIAAYEGPFDIPEPNLVHGENVLAVEVHQSDPFSEDVVFGVELDAVVPPPTPARFSSFRVAGAGQVYLSMPGQAGRTYVIESSADMRRWEPWAIRTNYYGSPLTITVGTTNSLHRFYRAFQTPLSCADR
jgi:hypothetical protein